MKAYDAKVYRDESGRVTLVLMDGARPLASPVRVAGLGPLLNAVDVQSALGAREVDARGTSANVEEDECEES